MPIDVGKLHKLFEDAVKNGVAPGFQYELFTHDKVLASDAVGSSKLTTGALPVTSPMLPQTPLSLASGVKILVSIMVLAVLERRLPHNGMTLDDLDNHEKLVEILPEFASGSKSIVGKIFDGWEPKLGPDGRKVPILREPKTKITLRHMFTDTSGHPYLEIHRETSEFYRPSDGSVPLRLHPYFSGRIFDLEVPMMCEPGTETMYGIDTDWLGIFAVRATGGTKSIHTLLREFVFDPLGLPESEFSTRVETQFADNLAHIYQKSPDGHFEPQFFTLWDTPEEIPPPGYAHVATAYGSTRMFCRVAQAVMCYDTRLLKRETWEMANGDHLKPFGIKISVPRWTPVDKTFTYTVDEFSPAMHSGDGSSANLIQTELATGQRKTGRPDKSYGWAMRFNSYYAMDAYTGFGYAFSAQIGPFFEPGVVVLRDDFERMIWDLQGKLTNELGIADTIEEIHGPKPGYKKILCHSW